MNHTEQIHKFWFGDKSTYDEYYRMNTKLWFGSNPMTDNTITIMFKNIVEEIASNISESTLTPKDALCSIIALDQFTRHIYRGTTAAFKYDPLSLLIVDKIINENWINNLSTIEAVFVYFALLHQESIEHVKRAVEGFDKLLLYTLPHNLGNMQNFKRSAEEHLKILEHFGRYPHRNLALGRESTDEETEFLKNNLNRSKFMRSQLPSKSKLQNKQSTNTRLINEPEISTNKLRILCLHGFRQNGHVFRTRTKKMIKELSDVAEFYFVSSPVVYYPDNEAKEAIDAAYEVMPDFQNQRTWWLSIENNKYYKHNEESLEFLKQVFINQGPFDGVLGFAQAGCLAAIMTTKGFNTQFIISISGYYPRAEEFQYMNIPNSLPTPSLHILGKKDILVIPERSRKLAEIFINGKLIEHEGGHFVPNGWPFEEMKNFMKQFTPFNNEKKIETKVDWHNLIFSTNENNLDEIATKIAIQLKKDFAIGYNIQQIECLDKFHFDKPSELLTGICPSECVSAMLGKRHTINKTFGLSSVIATKLFPNVESSKQLPYFEKAIQILKRMRKKELAKYEYKTNQPSLKTMSKLNTIVPPDVNDLKLSKYITNPIPEAVVPCALHELNPLLDFLSNNFPVTEQTAFPKGTITTDGRLDLCKQVVGPGGIGPLIKAMNKSSHVKRLLLGNNIVSDTGAVDIANEMKVSKLEAWYIAGNEFTHEGISHITEALKENIHCTSLWLKRNPLGPLSMPHIASMLKINKTIAVLDLVNCGILDEGLSILLNAFMGENKNTSLKVLWLDTNGITYKSASLIAQFIATDCVLEDFSLSCNRLCDIGIKEIAPAISTNSVLQRISFASNRIGSEGAKALCDALNKHTSINFLNLGFLKSTVAVGESANFLSDLGSKYIAEMLMTNKSIRHLDLLHNSISQLGVNHIIEALKVNNTLVKLQLTQFGKTHNEPGKEYIKEKLENNYKLLTDDEKIIVDEQILPWYIRDIYSVYIKY
jgi:uncharacterized protein (DUF924 family)/Ran GTPase-activating protein (RanGAP) involved in mRNA processing and transport